MMCHNLCVFILQRTLLGARGAQIFCPENIAIQNISWQVFRPLKQSRSRG